MRACHPVLLLVFILFLSACKDKGSTAAPTMSTIKLDSSLGIGNKIEYFFLPGRIVAYNPDSANRVIIVGKEGKIVGAIYRNIDSAGRQPVLNKVAVDSSSMEIYIYSPLEHHILVYDTIGRYKNSIVIQRVHNGDFSRIRGKFLFLDKTDSTKKDTTRTYVTDSAGVEVDGL